MSDIERLEAWMAGRNLTIWELGREMSMPRITIYTVVKRRQKITDAFVTSFIRRYGADEASKIFVHHLAPTVA